MNRIAGYFMKSAAIYGIVGFALGIYMGVRHEYGLLSIHSHLGLLGWATFALCAIYYQVVPGASEMAVAKVHFWSSTAGLIVLATSLALMSSGVSAAEPGAAVGSVLSFAGLAMFLYVVFATTKRTSW